MKGTIILFALIASFIDAFAQDGIENVLKSIEQNNKTLAAFKAETAAAVAGNKTGLTPDNPEAEYGYLWGTPSSTGNRNDFSVLQSFDFPLAYKYRSQIASLKNDRSQIEYIIKRNELFHSARRVIAELIYLDALLTEYSLRLEHAEQIVFSYQKRFDSGDANVLDLNKAKVSSLNLVNQIERIKIDHNYAIAELERLNGGREIDYGNMELEIPLISTDFEEWIEQVSYNNPLIQSLEQEGLIARKQIQLSKALRLPKISAGYMSEKLVGEHFQGITAGITIPLWENRNTVEYARARADAVSMRTSGFRFQIYSEMRSLYNKAVNLQKSTVGFEKSLEAVDNRPLLEKALEAGQISLSEYLLELAVYYNSMDSLLELKRDALTAYFDLFMYSGSY